MSALETGGVLPPSGTPVVLLPGESAVSLPRPADPTTRTDQLLRDAQKCAVGSGPSSAPAATNDLRTSKVEPSRRDADLLLYLFADQLDDVESLRIATANRLRTLTSEETWGKGVPADLPEARAVQAQLEQIQALEHGVTLSLRRAMRAHYLGLWCKATVGVGEKQLGRLLAVIGDPASRDRPSQLWAYCGLHVVHPGQVELDTHLAHAGVAPSRTRGQRANWSTEARTRTYLIAESCVKQRRSPYRPVYDDGRVKYAAAVHVHPCVRCGPSGAPAQPGSPLSLGHQHARAMRLVMKALLRDLWREARKVSS